MVDKLFHAGILKLLFVAQQDGEKTNRIMEIISLEMGKEK